MATADASLRDDASTLEDPSLSGVGPGGSGPGGRRAGSVASSRAGPASLSGSAFGAGPPGPAGGPGPAPSRADRPVRKGSTRAGSVAASDAGSLRGGGGAPPSSSSNLPLQHSAATSLPAAAPGNNGATNLQRYQATLSNNLDAATLAALQNETVAADPLLQQLDPFLGRGGGGGGGAAPAASPALSSLAGLRPGGGGGGGGGAPAAATHPQFTQAELSTLPPDMLRALVAAIGRDGGHQGPEKVDVSPPRTPPAATVARVRPDPAGVVAEVERRELDRAARQLLDETVEGIDVRRRALEHFYNTGQDAGAQAYGGDLLGDVGRFDATQMMQLQRAARVDLFSGQPNLGIPHTVGGLSPAVRRGGPGGARGSAYLVGTDDPHEAFHVTRDIMLSEDADVSGMLGSPDERSPQGPVRMLAPQPIPGASKSLLVGVGYLGTAYDIPENNKSVHVMKSHLMEQGFFGQQIVLTDDCAAPDRQPTYANILTGLRWLVEGAVAGSALFLHYAGRAQQRDPGTDASDLLPSDFETAGALPDAAVSEILSTLPRGVKLTIVADCFPCGQLTELPFKMLANTDGSFRVVEGRRPLCEAHVVQVSTKPDPNGQPEASGALPALTKAYVDVCGRGRGPPSYRDFMIGLRDGLAATPGVTCTPCVALNKPVDFKRERVRLAAPDTVAEEDPRLCNAREATKKIIKELAEEEDEKEQLARKNAEAMEEWKDRAGDYQDEVVRRRRLDLATQGLKHIADSEGQNRRTTLHEESTARHALSRLRHSNEDRILRSAMATSGWSRVAAPECTAMPVVCGVKWQRDRERGGGGEAGGGGLLAPDGSAEPQQAGQSSRTFHVVPRPDLRRTQPSPPRPTALYQPRPHVLQQPQRESAPVEPSPLLMHTPQPHGHGGALLSEDPFTAGHLFGGGGGAAGGDVPGSRWGAGSVGAGHGSVPRGAGGAGGTTMPLSDDRVVRWKRVEGPPGEPPQWIREEVAATPPRGGGGVGGGPEADYLLRMAMQP